MDFADAYARQAKRRIKILLSILSRLFLPDDATIMMV